MTDSRESDRAALRIYQQLFDLDSDEHPAFLDRACGGDTRLRELVDKLMAAPAEFDSAAIRGAINSGTREVEAARRARQGRRSGPTSKVSGDEPLHDETARPGGRIGPYELIRSLGAGGMGVVWLARHVESDERVAIKMLRSYGLPSEQKNGWHRRLLREAKVMRRLRHSHIATYLDTLADDDSVYLVLEYIDGVTLDRWLKREPRPTLRRRLQIVRQVLSALEYIHEHDVTHRDLKPNNIMLTRDGAAKVLDFGLATMADATSFTRTGVVLGTPLYMAPEQAGGQPVDSRADLWAVGMIVMAVLEDDQPQSRAGANDLCRGLLLGVPADRYDWLPDGLRELVASLLQRRPEDRIPTAAAAGAELDRVLGGSALESKLERAKRSRRGLAPRLPELPRYDVDSAVGDLLDRAAMGQAGSLLLLGPMGSGRSHTIQSIGDRLTTAGIEYRKLGFVDSASGRTGRGEVQRAGRLAQDSITLSSGGRPAAVLVDDLHLASEEQCAAVERLVQRAAETSLAIIAAGDLDPLSTRSQTSQSYSSLLARLVSRHDIAHVTLTPFEPAVVKTALAPTAIAPRLLDRVLALSGGNPRTVNMLLERIHDGDSLSELPLLVPAVHRRRLQRRWDRLEDDARRLLNILLDKGGSARLDELIGELGQPPLRVHAMLRELTTRLGWVHTTSDTVSLHEPFLGAIDRDTLPDNEPAA